jgi:hypothetical protein
MLIIIPNCRVPMQMLLTVACTWAFMLESLVRKAQLCFHKNTVQNNAPPPLSSSQRGKDKCRVVLWPLGLCVLYYGKPPPCLSLRVSNYYCFYLGCLWYLTKVNIWIVGKQPRSVENIYSNPCLWLNPLSHPPTLEARSDLGGPYFECFFMT